MPPVDKQFDPIPEKTSQVLTFTLKDELGVAIPGSALTTMTMTLYDRATSGPINNRDHVDVKPFVDVNGLLTFSMDPADNPIVNDALTIERHIALFEWTYASGVKAGKTELGISVRNIVKVT